ncbi:MAG: hypothetical protein IK056_02055 [Clostridia bacterium]|nr:hypothetical protein [Clostridia bacterium]
MKKCVLDETKICDNCGECERCDLDPSKKCDNCMKCVISEGTEYRAIKIDGIQLSESDSDKGSK